MRDIGILYTEENRLAVIEDRKTMTRRLPASFKEINEKPDEWLYSGLNCDGDALFHPWSKVDPFNINDTVIVKLPYAVGDLLYIKEPHYLYGRWESSLDTGSILGEGDKIKGNYPFTTCIDIESVGFSKSANHIKPP